MMNGREGASGELEEKEEEETYAMEAMSQNALYCIQTLPGES